MSTKPRMKKASPQANGPERFDQNEILCAGEIVRLWPSDNDIIARLRIAGPVIPESGNFISTSPQNNHETQTFPKPHCDEKDQNFTLRIPNSEINGDMVTLSPGDKIKLKGYLQDFSYHEGIQTFLHKAKQKDLFEGTAQCEKLEQVNARRFATAIVPISLERVDPHNAQPMISNRFRGSGLVVKKTWRRSGNLFARVTSYDRHTVIEDPNGGKGGRPRRRSHYWSICIPSGQINGKEITLKQGQRIRVAGSLAGTTYLENLHEFMVRAKAAGLLAKIADMDTSNFTEIKIFRSGLFVLVSSLVQFS